MSANFDAINHRKRHDSDSGSSDDEEEEDGGAEFRRKKRRSEGGHARERLQETPSYTGGVSRDAKERQVRRYNHFTAKRRKFRKMTADGASQLFIIVINFQRWLE